MQISIDGRNVLAHQVACNSGLNYGRFDAPGLEIRAYSFFVERGDLVAKLQARYFECVEEIRLDDTKHGDGSIFKQMGYVPLERAFSRPAELAEAIACFFDRQIFELYLPWRESVAYVINSSDKVVVAPDGLTIEGRCFARVADRRRI